MYQTKLRNVSNQFARYTGATGQSGGAMDYFPTATLVNSTTVRITRVATTGATNYSFFVVELK